MNTSKLPSHEDLMLPMLKILGDGDIHSLSEIADILAVEFDISEQQRKELLPSGKYPVFRSRIGWAKTYMSKAGLVSSPGRAKYQITEEGINLLSRNISRIDRSTLSTYQSFKKFIGKDFDKNDSSNTVDTKSVNEIVFTPQERIESSYQSIYNQLSNELMEEIMQNSPTFFENLVVDLIVGMGYGGSRGDAGKAIGGSGDGGIDGIINEDRLGLDVIYIQAKRYTSSVPIGHIRDFAGALMGKRAKKGIFITTSTFPKSALEFVQVLDHKIILIDGARLTNLMIEYNIGVEIEQVYYIKKVNTDYFDEVI